MRNPNEAARALRSRAHLLVGVALFTLAVLAGCGRGGGGGNQEAAAPTAKADAVVVTYYYLPG